MRPLDKQWSEIKVLDFMAFGDTATDYPAFSQLPQEIGLVRCVFRILGRGHVYRRIREQKSAAFRKARISSSIGPAA